MKRRDFLKILGTAPAVAALPVLAKADKPHGELTTHIYKNEIPSGLYDVKVGTRPMSTREYLDAMNKSINHAGEVMAAAIRKEHILYSSNGPELALRLSKLCR